MTGSSKPLRPLSSAILIGAAAFGLPSLVVFATVAYGERWMYQQLGLWGAYGVWTLLFILPAGLGLAPLVAPERRRAFPVLFAGSFVLYALGWMAGYFLLRRTLGEQPAELVASLAASALLALGLVAGLGRKARFLSTFGVLAVTNTVGYFLGGALYALLGRPLGMLLWGVAYGLLLGAGLGLALRNLDA